MNNHRRYKSNGICYAIFLLLILHGINDIEAKRIYSSGNSRRASTGYSANVRRNSYHKPSSSSYSHSNPSLTHTGLSSLSYSGYNSQPKRPSNTNSASVPRATSAPIGWSAASKSQGPPPAYSAANPVGGAKTNIHEAPPAYKSSNSAPPSYSQASSHQPVRPVNQQTQQTNNYNRNRFNSTGGFGAGSVHTPIRTNSAGNLQSGYPSQNVPSGATYYPAGSHLPAGASYHPSGSLPPGATYHSAGSLPAGATYYPSGSLPAGATYHSPGALPAGATYYPSGGLPAGATYHSPGHLPPGATYYPSHAAAPAPAYYPAQSALPAGATFLPAGSAIPAGATYISQPPKSSSGLGFGSGLLAGGLAGGLLGHALTPTHTKVIEHAPVVSGGGGVGGVGAPSGGGEDRIIIINNGPPGSVTTSEVGKGTTVINTGVNQPPAANQPTAENTPLAPINPITPDNSYTNPNPTLATGAAVGTAGAAGIAAAAAAASPAVVSSPTDATVTPAPPVEPQNGGIICTPVKVSEPDPNDSSKVIEVEKIACYPASALQNTTDQVTPEAGASTSTTQMQTLESTPSTSTSTAEASSSTTVAQESTTKENIDNSPSLDAGALSIPDGSVALAPLNSNGHPDIVEVPGLKKINPSHSALIDEKSGIHVASGVNSPINSTGLLTLSTILLILISNSIYIF